MRRRVVSALVCALLLSVVTPVAPSPAAADGGAEAQFVAAVNAARAQGGLPPLEVDGNLTGAARRWAQQQADGVCGVSELDGRYTICHVSTERLRAEAGPGWLTTGENVGRGGDVGPIMTAFIDSPGHYKNIMDPRFTHIGVGVVWNGDTLYTTHRFMQVGGGPAAELPPGPQEARAPRAPRATAPAEPPPPPLPEFPPPPTAVPSRVAVVLAALRAAPL